MIEKLKALQGEKPQAMFAAELGIAQSTLSRLYNGDQDLGADVGKKIAAKFPKLKGDVAAFLLGDDAPAEQGDSLIA